MSDLTNLEKRQFEKLFGMDSGYVLNFSNRTFDEFVIDSTGLSIMEGKYNKDSGSKANRLRAFWSMEPNHVVVKLLQDLMQCVSLDSASPEIKKAYEDCSRAVARLSGGKDIPDIISLTPNSPEREFAVLAREVRESIERNEPEVGLDRLHTFTVKYLRVLCEQKGITTDRDKPLHSLAGEYVKSLKESGHLESEMTERILKSGISTLDAFNKVRNEQSLAHDNRILNYDEALLIYSHVASAIRFIEALERKIAASKPKQSPPSGWNWQQSKFPN
jgi:abortive infection Abi-like protein